MLAAFPLTTTYEVEQAEVKTLQIGLTVSSNPVVLDT